VWVTGPCPAADRENLEHQVQEFGAVVKAQFDEFVTHIVIEDAVVDSFDFESVLRYLNVDHLVRM
jgi:hypothetical protein